MNKGKKGKKKKKGVGSDDHRVHTYKGKYLAGKKFKRI